MLGGEPGRPRPVSGWFERSENRDGARSAEALCQAADSPLSCEIARAEDHFPVMGTGGEINNRDGARSAEALCQAADSSLPWPY